MPLFICTARSRYLNDTQPHATSFTAQLERLARGGVNTVMVYDVLGFPPDQLDRLFDDLQVIGIRVVLMVVGEITPLAYGNTTSAWGAFAALVDRFKSNPALLGWYLLSRGGTNMAGTPFKLPLFWAHLPLFWAHLPLFWAHLQHTCSPEQVHLR